MRMMYCNACGKKLKMQHDVLLEDAFEAKKQWGQTAEYKEYEEKTKNQSSETQKTAWKNRYCSQVGTFGTESAVRKRGGSRNLPYLNAKPRQIPLLGTYA